MVIVRALLVVLFVPSCLIAQAPGVPVFHEGPDARPFAGIRAQVKQLRSAGALLSQITLAAQTGRRSCSLTLPPLHTRKLDSRELWQRARNAHIRIGWNYLCKECSRWHIELSGGYAITSDTVVTCAHVIGGGHDDEMREGYLMAVDEADHVIPVQELLAINRATDTAILKLKTDQLQPLPLTTDVVPGDQVVCYSDPLDRRGVYSTGVVERFMKRHFLHKDELTPDELKNFKALEQPVWVQVSTDWAQGSSGSAVLDTFGNAIGHVSEIQTMLDDSEGGPTDEEEPAASGETPKSETKPEQEKHSDEPPGTVIVFHDAITASNVRAMIKP